VEAEKVLDRVGITLNKNMIADDTRSAMDPSGIRFGTPAMTTRGMKEKEATKLAEIMITTMRAKNDLAKINGLQNEVQTLCESFPVPEVLV
jgi:glycine hydroxymethyltransferase